MTRAGITHSLHAALHALRDGRFVVVVDELESPALTRSPVVLAT